TATGRTSRSRCSRSTWAPARSTADRGRARAALRTSTVPRAAPGRRRRPDPAGTPRVRARCRIVRLRWWRPTRQPFRSALSPTDVDGQAGAGLVTVTMRGTGEVTGVKVDPQVVDPEDVDTLQDLIVGAFGDAHTKGQELAETRLGPLAQGGGGLGDMMGGLGM